MKVAKQHTQSINSGRRILLSRDVLLMLLSEPKKRYRIFYPNVNEPFKICFSNIRFRPRNVNKYFSIGDSDADISRSNSTHRHHTGGSAKAYYATGN